MKLDHIGIAVKNLEKANNLYALLLQKQPDKIENVASEDVMVSFFKTETSKIELLQSTSSKSIIENFITKNGEGIHHIAFKVDDINAEIKRLQKEGFQLINTAPKIGAANNLVAFLHPKSTNGVLIELCQPINR